MKRHRRIGNGTLLRFGALMVSCATVTLLAGCGGGGSSVRTVSKTPTKAVQKHVQAVHTISLSNMAFSGIPVGIFSAMRGGYGGGAAIPVAATGTANGATSTVANATAPILPETGQFLRNMMPAPTGSLGKGVRAGLALNVIKRVTRSGSAGSSGGSVGGGLIAVDPPIDFFPMPTFYYDDYLGLWVDIVNTTSSTSFNLYVDEAKTQPAGSIVTSWPATSAYPQVYSSSYSYTAGTEAGASGSYTSTQNADGSGSSTYQNTNTDGSKVSGSSSYTVAGDYTWTGRTDNADKSYSTMSGTFHADGSGTMQYQDSAGYKSNYTYNADGSGGGTITGPDPGLPATITWDIQGNTTITFADGSLIYIPGWGFGVAVPETTTPISGVTSSSTGVTTAPTPPASPGK